MAGKDSDTNVSSVKVFYSDATNTGLEYGALALPNPTRTYNYICMAYSDSAAAFVTWVNSTGDNTGRPAGTTFGSTSIVGRWIP